jgi:hypothetical protein
MHLEDHEHLGCLDLEYLGNYQHFLEDLENLVNLEYLGNYLMHLGCLDYFVLEHLECLENYLKDLEYLEDLVDPEDLEYLGCLDLECL